MPMDRFPDDREALDFIASQIAEEAQREGVPFSEAERKMLYFSETAWTLPDIWEVSDKFDQEYERTAYEKKISLLIKKSVARARKQHGEELDVWRAAIRHLSKEDRYLLVMVGQAGLGQTVRSARFHRDWWKVLGESIAVAALFVGFTWLLATINPQPGAYRPRSGTYGSPLTEVLSFSVWAFSFSIAALYALARWLVGAHTFEEFVSRATEWIFGRQRRK
jgi:hypothetical protein